MQQQLAIPILYAKLSKVLGEMKCRTSFGLDKIVLEILKEYWPIIGYDYLAMISLVSIGKFSPRVTSRLIDLLHKREYIRVHL